MIIQAILDFFRDGVVNWLRGINIMLEGIPAQAAGAAIGGVADNAGHVLSLFISNDVWPGIATTWGVWMGVWLTTGLIAIIARRFSS